jgi:hypothetical protein
MSTKFEQLLDLLVNEEHEKANELFHEIVVEKSRDIYENLIAQEAKDEEEDESVEEADDQEEDESVEEGFGEPEGEEGGDATDDFVSSIGADDAEGGEDDMDSMGGEEDGTPATKADVQDLEDALDELKAEFEKLMAGEEEEPEHQDMFGGEEEGEADDEEGEADDEEGDEEESDEDESYQFGENRQLTREYREKVGNDWDKNSQKTDGQIAGANTGEKMPTASSGKSPVSSGSGKPVTGASAHNILAGGTGVGNNTGTSPNAKGPSGVLKAGGQFTSANTKNVSSSANSKSPDGAKLSSVAKPNRTAEFKPVGAATGGTAGQTGSGNTRSPADRKQ